MKNYTNPNTPDIKVVTISQLFEMDIPQPEMIVNPIISEKSLSMIYAYRGVGKTHLSLEIAYCVAHGINIFNDKWKVTKPRRVLFVDGEMPSGALLNRLRSIHERYHKELNHDLSDNFRIISNDIQDEDFSLIDLGRESSREELSSKFIGADFVVLDNLSSLTRSGKENEADSYSDIQAWLLNLRRKKISVLIVHHAGKDGNQRGTSKREDVLDTVIKLTKVSKSKSDNGCAFEVSFEKNRHFYGSIAEPFEARLDSESGWNITHKEGSSVLDEQDKLIIDLLEQGMPRDEICDKVGIQKSGLSKRIKKLKENGHVLIEQDLEAPLHQKTEITSQEAAITEPASQKIESLPKDVVILGRKFIAKGGNNSSYKKTETHLEKQKVLD